MAQMLTPPALALELGGAAVEGDLASADRLVDQTEEDEAARAQAPVQRVEGWGEEVEDWQ